MRPLLLLALVACGNGSSSEPDAPLVDAPVGPPRETFTNTLGLEAGELVEGIMPGGPGDRAVIRLSAIAPEIEWNIHAHPPSGLVVVYEEFNVMTVEYDFVPTEEAEWYLLLENSGPTDMDIEIEIDLYGDMTFELI